MWLGYNNNKAKAWSGHLARDVDGGDVGGAQGLDRGGGRQARHEQVGADSP